MVEKPGKLRDFHQHKMLQSFMLPFFEYKLCLDKAWNNDIWYSYKVLMRLSLVTGPIIPTVAGFPSSVWVTEVHHLLMSKLSLQSVAFDNNRWRRWHMLIIQDHHLAVVIIIWNSPDPLIISSPLLLHSLDTYLWMLFPTIEVLQIPRVAFSNQFQV